MNTKDYVIIGLSVALTLTLLAVIMFVVTMNGQLKHGYSLRDGYGTGDILTEVDKAKLAVDNRGIEDEVAAIRARNLARPVNPDVAYKLAAIAAEYDF